MRKRKYLIGAMLGVIGSVVLASTASAAVTGQTVSSIVNPSKAPKKTFVAVKSMKTTVDTNYSGGFTPNGTQTVVTFSKDVKFTPGNIAQCNLSTIATVPEATANATCGASRVGSGSATINGGALTGKVAAYNGVPSGGSPTIGLHTDVFTGAGTYAFSTTLTGVLNTGANTLTVAIPPTGTSITHFETTINKKKSGKKTFYIMARCKKKKWVTSETTTFNDGTSQSATSKQKCKQTKEPKKK
ncbi:MAG TPA: hypothetical protein VHR38_04205 [Solirubrobacterales bacterium]|jgi:hypothetical protein|nr:hypothetical protein [Solirubrobacterales bacterium]